MNDTNSNLIIPHNDNKQAQFFYSLIKINMGKTAYRSFFGMLLLSFCIMYAVMFLNVSGTDHIYLSATRFYMSLLMVSPMALLMLGMMGKMYPDKKRNSIIAIAAVAIFVCAFTFLRQQTFIGDRQYMKAMIPHHSSAILTSENADIQDPEVRKLADGIIAAQKKEIAEMKALLKKLDEHQ